jgi:hypothetical protein
MPLIVIISVPSVVLIIQLGKKIFLTDLFANTMPPPLLKGFMHKILKLPRTGTCISTAGGAGKSQACK